MSAAQLKAEFLRLLKEDEEFRYAVAGLLGFREILDAIRGLQEQVTRNTDAIRSLQEQVVCNTEAIRALQEQVAHNTEAIRSLQEQVARNTEAIRALQEQVAEHSKAIRALQEQVARNTEAIRALQEQVRALQEQVASLQEQMVSLQEQMASLQEQVISLQRQVNLHSEVLEKHSEHIKELTRTIQALGARWGILAEESFREAMKGVIERRFGGKVRRWTYYDSEGFVFGHPSIIEVDLLITDREHMLMKVKSSVSRADVFELWRVGQLYERIKGVKPRLAVISPFVRPEAKKAAEELGIEVYTSLSL